MAKYYKTIAADEYLQTFLNESVRPDGRAFSESRELKIHHDFLEHADASCMLSIGSTIVTCVLLEELTDTKPGDTLKEYLDIHTDLPHLSRQHLRSGQSLHLSTSLSSSLTALLHNSDCINLEELYDEESKTYRRLRCELVVLNDDGCLFDVLTLSLASSLHQVLPPKPPSHKPLNELLITLSFGVLNDGRVLADVTKMEEEEIPARVVLVASLLHQQVSPLSTRGASMEAIRSCHVLGMQRLRQVMQTLEGKH